MLLERHYQNAYVTPDLDRAVDALQTRLGAGEFKCSHVECPLWTPNGDGVAVMKVGLVWVGDLQYELIQPISGAVDIYQEAVRPDRLLTFHHIAMRVDEWDQLEAEVARQDLPRVQEGKTDFLRFVYFDARDTLGHYLEYMWAKPEVWATFGR
jgi:hypothetical protein